MVNVVSDHTLFAGAVALCVTAVQLWRRFSQRRPFSSAVTTALFALTCATAAGTAAALERVDISKLSLVGLGASYPFWAPRPGTDAGRGPDSAVAGSVIEVLWKIPELFLDPLDTRLAHRKTVVVQQVSAAFTAWYDGLQMPAAQDYPCAERLQSTLKREVGALTDPALRKTRKAALRFAYERARADRGDIQPLVSLAYDWRLDGLLYDLMDEQCAPTPPPPLTDAPRTRGDEQGTAGRGPAVP